jgi:hypothetical protein
LYYPTRPVKTFHCTNCQNLVFFENNLCLACGHVLAYLPDRGDMAALQQGADGLWQVKFGSVSDGHYRLCGNYVDHDNCNWAVPASSPEALCQSCRLTTVIPDLSVPESRKDWYRLETAKRRLVYTLLALQLPVTPKSEANSTGLAFEFLMDSTKPNGDWNRVFTGHDDGLITINVAEANDVQREQQRAAQNEPYRTLLGHFRHESGHYYWDRLVEHSDQLQAFRKIFGDERASYADAMQRHYKSGPPANWQSEYVSAYATMHPWEDWAETWAHFLHIVDTLETATSAGLQLQPQRHDEPSLSATSSLEVRTLLDFDKLIDEWLPLTYVMNNLSRGLGLSDAYPFVLSAAAISKLRFVSDTVMGSARPGP